VTGPNVVRWHGNSKSPLPIHTGRESAFCRSFYPPVPHAASSILSVCADCSFQGSNALIEHDLPFPKRISLDTARFADPVHAEMPEIVTLWIPGDEIPKWRQDQHGLRFDNPAAAFTFRILIIEPKKQAPKEGDLEFGKQCRVHRTDIGSVHLRREFSDIQAVQKLPQVPNLVRRKRLLDLCKSGICQAGKREVPGRAHRCNADQKSKDFRHRKARRGLDRTRIESQSAATTGFGMNDKAFFPQGTDVAQQRSSGCPHLCGKLGNRRRPVPSQASYDSRMSTVNIHSRWTDKQR
jgi:hypothetical protein